MYKHWIQWQKGIGEEINRDNEFDSLFTRKHELKVEMGYLQRELGQAYSVYSKLKLALSKARCEFHIVDFKLAMIDGRMSVCDSIREEQVREKNLKSITDQLSPNERSELLAELEGMED